MSKRMKEKLKQDFPTLKKNGAFKKSVHTENDGGSVKLHISSKDNWTKVYELCHTIVKCLTHASENDLIYSFIAQGNLLGYKLVYYLTGKDFLYTWHYVIEKAEQSGHIKICYWIAGMFKKKGLTFPHDIEGASKNGHLHILKWKYLNADISPTAICMDACRLDRSDILDWLYDLGELNEVTLASLSNAIRYKSSNALQWIINHIVPKQLLFIESAYHKYGLSAKQQQEKRSSILDTRRKSGGFSFEVETNDWLSELAEDLSSIEI